MTNLLKIIFLLFASAILFTSCKTASITKRHYNKGYYVSHTHKKKAPAKVEREPGKITPSEVAKAEVLVPKHTVASPVKEEEKSLAASTPQEEFIPAAKPAKKFFGRNNNNSVYTNEQVDVKEFVRNPVKLAKMAAKDTGDDALSLLWILIVVLLILYIVGILTEGFGLGGIIHVLGVIVLVLLILWLLRII
jgi:hypothetical protein